MRASLGVALVMLVAWWRPACSGGFFVTSISGRVLEYIVAIDVARVLSPADALSELRGAVPLAALMSVRWGRVVVGRALGPHIRCILAG